MTARIDVHDDNGQFGPADYWACRQPERPYDYDHTWFSEYCRSCVLALGAAAMNCPPDTLILTAITNTEEPLRAAYDRERRRHQLPPLPAEMRHVGESS